MSNADLAQIIRDLFTPFAFSCECNGADYDCQDALQNAYMYGVMDTVTRIANYIEKGS
jgi:hypothetical protein